MNLRKASKLVLGVSIKTVFWVICLSVFIFICGKAFSFGNQIFSEEGMASEGYGEDITITIPSGADASAVAEILYEEELIKNKWIFQIQSFLYEAEFAAGEYVLNTEYSGQKIVETLRPASES